MTETLNATPEECKRLRDEEGMAWNKIGEALSLWPGTTTADMKKRGHMARKLYAEGGTAHTPSRVRSTSSEPKEPKAPRAPREKKGKVPRGSARGGGVPIRLSEGPVSDHLLGLPEDECVDLLRGKTIKWRIRIDENGAIKPPNVPEAPEDHISELEARVGPKTAQIRTAYSGNPTLCFNEPAYGSRAVYLAAIYEVCA